jgi:hypothetical protein
MVKMAAILKNKSLADLIVLCSRVAEQIPRNVLEQQLAESINHPLTHTTPWELQDCRKNV